jgi:hypothetical protein
VLRESTLAHHEFLNKAGTLKFADAVGEVLISGPTVPNAPLPFRHYI